jgi:hypothetical protein
LEGAASLAATSASGIQGGNFQIFENFLNRSGAKVYLNTPVILQFWSILYISNLRRISGGEHFPEIIVFPSLDNKEHPRRS